MGWIGFYAKLAGAATAKAILIFSAIVLAVIVISNFSSINSEKEPRGLATQSEKIHAFVNSLPVSTIIEQYEVNSIGSTDVSITAWAGPDGKDYFMETRAAVMQACEALARETVRLGWNPYEDRLTIMCYAQADAGRGVSGRELVQPMGYAHYDRKSDSIDYTLR